MKYILQVPLRFIWFLWSFLVTCLVFTVVSFIIVLWYFNFQPVKSAYEFFFDGSFYRGEDMNDVHFEYITFWDAVYNRKTY